jgi:hypothetical protein
VLSAFALTALLAVPAAGQVTPSDASFVDRASRLAAALLGPDNPFYIRIGGITTGAGFSIGPGVRLKGLAGGHLDVDALAIVSHRKYLLAETSVTTPIPGVEGLRAGAFLRRKYFPQEDFFGIGPDSPKSDRVNYSYDETSGGALVTATAGSRVHVDGRLEYRRPDVGAGHDDSVPSIEWRFTDESTPGLLRQPDFLVGAASFVYEGATPVGRPHTGGRYEVSLGRFWGRETSAYDFLRFDADLRQYVPIVPERHILVFRGVAAITSTPAGSEVPFYYLPWLGGSRSLRGFRDLRFHDRNTLLWQAEYRWLPIRFVEAALFYDGGAVSPDLSQMTRNDTFSDYGIGVRFGTDARVFFRVEAAFGSSDGTRVFAKFSAAF